MPVKMYRVLTVWDLGEKKRLRLLCRDLLHLNAVKILHA